MREAFSTPRFLLYLITLSLFKAFMFLLFFWLPIYLQNQGLKLESFIYPILVNVFSIVGSACIGLLYKQSSAHCQRSSWLNYILIILAVISCACLTVLSYVKGLGSIPFLILMVIVGFSLGGGYTSYQSN